MQREFSKEEARRIFADAAERQQAALRDTDERLTLDELEQAAVAAGIDPAYIRAAAESAVRPDHGPAERRVLGLPVHTRQSLVLPFPVGDQEWSQIVVELRSIFKKHGIATEIGTIREWMSETNEGKLPIRITIEPEGDDTRLTIERSMWQQSLGFGAGTASMFVTSLILFILSAAGPEDQIWIPAFIIMMFGVLFGAGAFVGTRMASRRDLRRFEEVIRRVRRIGESGKKARRGVHQASPSLTIEEAEPMEQDAPRTERHRTRG